MVARPCVVGGVVETEKTRRIHFLVGLFRPSAVREGKEIKKTIKISVEEEWQQIWQTIPQCGTAKSFFAVLTTQHRKFIKWMSTKEPTTLIQAATGHGLFAGHLSRWRESLPSTCKLCGKAEETLLHLFGECPALELERFHLLRFKSQWIMGKVEASRDLQSDIVIIFNSVSFCKLWSFSTYSISIIRDL